MKVMLDLNVLLDVVQRREPFYPTSATILSKAVAGEISGYLPSHSLTTLHYITRRYAGIEQAAAVVDWVLSHLEIVAQDKSQFVRARTLGFSDFEDAALVSAAEAAGCECIVTRNIADFDGSPVLALIPEEFLIRIKGAPEI